MKKMLAVVCGVLISSGVSFAATLTFDDLQVSVGNPIPMPQGYGGLNWTNMWVVTQDPSWIGAGLGDALPPGDNAADNGFWGCGTISAPIGQTFTLNAAYMASCWWYPETLEVNGYLAGRLMYTQTYDLSPNALSLVEFPVQIIDSATFTPWATPGGSGTTPIIAQFLMDSLTINATAGKVVPWKGISIGRLTPDTTGAGLAYTVAEAGVATHVGIFTEVATPDPTTGVTWITITAENKDQLYGVVVGTSGSLPVVKYNIVIFDGTGWFKGAQGSYVETLKINPKTLEFIAESAGTISAP